MTEDQTKKRMTPPQTTPPEFTLLSVWQDDMYLEEYAEFFKACERVSCDDCTLNHVFLICLDDDLLAFLMFSDVDESRLGNFRNQVLQAAGGGVRDDHPISIISGGIMSHKSSTLCKT